MSSCDSSSSGETYSTELFLELAISPNGEASLFEISPMVIICSGAFTFLGKTYELVSGFSFKAGLPETG
jgi:hypothetical protein